MSQGLVNVCNAENVRHHPADCDLRQAHVVVLDDGDTYSGVPGARVYLDGKGYDIGDLLDFYLASVQVDDGQTYSDPTPEDRPVCPLPSSEGWPEDVGTISGGPYAGCRDDLGLDEDDQ